MSILYGEVHIFLDFVSEGGYVCEMDDAVVLLLRSKTFKGATCTSRLRRLFGSTRGFDP